MKNICYEEDTRHEVTDKVLRGLEKVAYDQDDFGMEKYNTPLHHSHKFGWLDMVDEELVDMMKYLQCEKDRKAEVIQLLEAAMRVNNPKIYVESALELLTITGTGK